MVTPVPQSGETDRSQSPVRVLVVDDNPVVVAGLLDLLAHHGDIAVVGTAVDGASAITEAARLNPDVVLLDVRMPGIDGVAAASRIAAHCRVVTVSYTHLTLPTICSV